MTRQFMLDKKALFDAKREKALTLLAGNIAPTDEELEANMRDGTWKCWKKANPEEDYDDASE